MKFIRIFFLFNFVVAISCTGIAQKQIYDVVSFTAPKGWQQQKNEGGVQLSVTDKKTGAYAIALITKATASDAGANPNKNFKTPCKKLKKASVPPEGQPTLQQTEK